MGNYNFKKIEQKWQKSWESKKIFNVKENSKKKKFYVLDMFPYPSGEGLHMGHAFTFSLGDIFARFKRLQGYNVLYPIGYDSLGLPAENAAIKKGTHPKKYTEQSITNFMKQQKAMGWSYDWSRLVMTNDPEYYRGDQWIFLQMLKKGLAYRKKSAVNYCSKCQTVLANEQVIQGMCWRHDDTKVEIKQLEQWYFKTTQYAEELLQGLDKLDWPERAKTMQRNWIGKSEGAEILFEINGKKWPIFTTRPDTIYGVTFMVVSAQHSKLQELVTEKQKKEVDEFVRKLGSVSEKELEKMDKEGVFTGSYAVNPMTKERIPIYAGNFVLADYGSGMIMAVPGHDSRDYDFAKKYNLKIKPVVLKTHEESFSYVMGVDEKDIKDIGVKIVEKTKDGFFKIKIPFDNLDKYKDFIRKNLKPGFWNEFSTPKGFYFIFKHKSGEIEEFLLDEKTNDIIDEYGMTFNKEKPKKFHENVYSWLAENGFYKELLIHQDFGNLINSGSFNDLDSDEAKEHIIKNLEEKKLGKKTVQFKLRDWLISRQRYWGTPIPVVYCGKCGIVPVPEKELPIKLPDKVEFGKGNPLATNEKWINVKCPKCKGKARRETDTMDTFVNSSWYYLRYCDSKNKKQAFDSKKANYWCPIDQYIGGPEHITMHLIYIRFYTKFLRDCGLINFSEPALKYFTQGVVKGSDGNRMSKSRGNVVEPLNTIEKYGADSLRLYLVGASSADSDINWDEAGISGSFKLVNKVYEYFSEIKFGKADPRAESKLNKTIKEVSHLAESFKHNLAIIRLRDFFDYMSERQIDKKTAEAFLQLLHVYCPFVTEELWQKIKGGGFISLSSWPKADEKKINLQFEKEEEAISSLVNDINNVKKFVNKASKVFIYVIPNELSIYVSNLIEISKRTNLNVKIYAVNDKEKYDPKGKVSKAKPGKPGIYLE
ncbi:leucine--tRNA ligase [Candidatus Pacearchaeota archaeon]|nr:leucine--tRNA ligase [Candidatus Pacearchaeota archaeon]